MEERDVQKLILQYLERKKIWHKRFNSGVRPGASGRPVRFGAKGLPDILARTSSGTVIWIEVKGPDGKLSEDQRKWKEDMERFGDTFVTARKLTDVHPCTP